MVDGGDSRGTRLVISWEAKVPQLSSAREPENSASTIYR